MSIPTLHTTTPLIRLGGVYVLFLGLAMLFAAFWPGADPLNPLLLISMSSIGFLAVFGLSRWLAYGQAPRWHYLVLAMAVIAEMILFLCLPLFNRTLTPDEMWRHMLVIIGIHFLPLGFIFGFKIVWLGLLIILNAFFSLTMPQLPFWFFALVDGALKLFYGLILLFHRPAQTV